MAVLFISHSSKDRAATTALELRLRANGFTGMFIDHHSIAGGDGLSCAELVLARLEGPRPPVRAAQLKQVKGVEGHFAVIGAADRARARRAGSVIAKTNEPAESPRRVFLGS
jgi:hypothetical protein